MNKILVLLKEEGCNVDDALERFLGDENLLLSFIDRFASDTMFIKMKSYLEQDDFENAFKYAHSLKGLAGNLEFTNFYKSIAAVSDNLKYSNYDNLKSLTDKATVEYDKILSIIR